MSIFRKAAPLLASSFVNKCGTIGLGLLPMILVEKRVSPQTAAWLMTGVKGSLLLGTWLGGAASDWLGMKRSMILAFSLSCVGLALLPFSQSLILIGFAGVLAQIGHSMYPGPARLMVTQLIPPEGRQESIGWLRTANNLGQIVSFSIGWFFSGFGIAPLILFDSFTSFAAAGLSATAIPDPPPPRHSAPEGKSAAISLREWRILVLATLITASFSFLYELFMVGLSARLRLLFGERGLALFAQSNLINTIFCAALAIFAARRLKNPNHVIPAGLLLAAAGGWLALNAEAHELPRIFTGVFLLTMGEVIFMAMSSYLVIRLTPSTRNQGSIYGTVLVIQSAGRILGGSLAFPLVVYGTHATLGIAAVTAFSLGVWWAIRNTLAEAFSV